MADLPNCPASREEAYLASIAGEGVEVPPCPRSRKEAYLDAIDGKMDDIEREIEDLKNNPDVVDIVDTYADLQAYDTSALTDKDVIRVLNDETHDGNSTFYRWNATTSSFDYIGEAGSSVDVFVGTDGIEPGEKGLVPAPAITDVNKFLKGNGNWEAIDGGLPTLTTADYNFPTTGTKTRIVLAYLEPGVYKVKKDGNGNLPVIALRDSTADLGYLEGDIIVVLRPRTTGTNYRVIMDVYRQSSTEYGGTLYYTNGSTSQTLSLLGTQSVIDNLTSNIAYYPLSAKQGKVLNDKISELEARVAALEGN